MGSFMTRWSVLQEHPVTAEDVDTEGLVTDDAVERWIAAASSAYLDQCSRLEEVRAGDGLEIRRQTAPTPPAARLGRANTVVVTASATEVRPSSFVVSVRLRPVGGEDDRVLNATCVVRIEDSATGAAHGIDDAIRDELITLEHTAQHFN